MKANVVHTITITHSPGQEIPDDMLPLILEKVGIQKPLSPGWLAVMQELFEILEQPETGCIEVFTKVEEINNG